MWNCMSAKHFLIFSKIFLFVMFVKFSFFSVLLGRPTANTFCFSFYFELLFMPYQNMLDVVIINWGSWEAQFHAVSCFQCALSPDLIRGATSVVWTVLCSATLLDDRVFCTSDTIWHHAISSGNPWHDALPPGRWHDALPPRHDASQAWCLSRVNMPHASVSAPVQITNTDITGNRGRRRHTLVSGSFQLYKQGQWRLGSCNIRPDQGMAVYSVSVTRTDCTGVSQWP